MKGSVLESRVVISLVPKEPLYRILEVLKLSGIETVDIAYTSVGDYFCIKNKTTLGKDIKKVLTNGGTKKLKQACANLFKKRLF